MRCHVRPNATVRKPKYVYVICYTRRRWRRTSRDSVCVIFMVVTRLFLRSLWLFLWLWIFIIIIIVLYLKNRITTQSSERTGWGGCVLWPGSELPPRVWSRPPLFRLLNGRFVDVYFYKVLFIYSVCSNEQSFKHCTLICFRFVVSGDSRKSS